MDWDDPVVGYNPAAFHWIRRVLPEPEWLTNYPGARKALHDLVAMGRIQSRLLGTLELLRGHVLGSRGVRIAVGVRGSVTLPTKRQIDAATKALATVRRVLEPFSLVPRVVDSPIHPEWDGTQEELEERDLGFLQLRDVSEALEWAQGGMFYLQWLIRRHRLEDVLKASITANAYDFKKGRYYDKPVAELITAATQELREHEQYSGRAHLSWRQDHKDLIERVKRVLVAELRRVGYDIALDKNGKATKWQQPQKPNDAGKGTKDPS